MPEHINVTPIKKHEFILGKLIPFWVLAWCPSRMT